MKAIDRRSAARFRMPITIALSICALPWILPACHEARRVFGSPDIALHVEDTTCASATVRWGDGSPDDQEQTVALPWSRNIGSADGLLLILAARRECDDSGRVTAEIRLDGRLDDRDSADGPFAVAAASTSFF